MKLWHQNLIKFLPNKELWKLHSDCCRMRGGWWGRGFEAVKYVWAYNPYLLHCYHVLVINEARLREFPVDEKWFNPYYRGWRLKALWEDDEVDVTSYVSGLIYPEHNVRFFSDDMEKLKTMGITIPYPNKV